MNTTALGSTPSANPATSEQNIMAGRAFADRDPGLPVRPDLLPLEHIVLAVRSLVVPPQVTAVLPQQLPMDQIIYAAAAFGG